MAETRTSQPASKPESGSDYAKGALAGATAAVAEPEMPSRFGW